MKIRFVLAFVIIYITLAFGWWLYSLIQLSNQEYKQEVALLEAQSETMRHEMLQRVLLGEYWDSMYPTFQYGYHPIYINYHKLWNSLGETNNKKIIGAFDTSEYNLVKALQYKPTKEAYDKLKDDLISRKRAYYSESIFFTLALVMGVIWFFSRLESIINLNRTQNNFLLSITHELKTPIATIKLISQTLKRKGLPDEKKEALLDTAISNSDRLNMLMDNLLLATRIDSKKHKFEFEIIEIEDIIRPIVENNQSNPNFKGNITTELKEGLSVMGDKVSLHLVFSNLIENAIKYSGGNIDINIQAKKTEKGVRVSIADKGLGIPESEWKNIFKKFYRIGDEKTRTTKGTGLGLFLVKQIMIQHKGNISLAHNQTKGIIFHLDFKYH